MKSPTPPDPVPVPVPVPTALKRAILTTLSQPFYGLINTSGLALFSCFTVSFVGTVAAVMTVQAVVGSVGNLITGRRVSKIEYAIAGMGRTLKIALIPGVLAAVWGTPKVAYIAAPVFFSRKVFTGLAIAAPIISIEHWVRGESQLSKFFDRMQSLIDPMLYFPLPILRYCRMLLALPPLTYTFKTLYEAIEFWKNISEIDINMQDIDSLTNSEKEALLDYLTRLTNTHEFISSETQKFNLAIRISNVLTYITKDGFRENAFSRIQDYLDTCSDWIILSLEYIEISMEVYFVEETATTVSEADIVLRNSGKKVFCMDKIREFVNQNLRSTDVVYQQLALQIYLSSKKTIPVFNTQNAFLYHFSGISNMDIDNAYKYIEKESNENFETFLEEWTPWKHRHTRVKVHNQLAEADNSSL